MNVTIKDGKHVIINKQNGMLSLCVYRPVYYSFIVEFNTHQQYIKVALAALFFLSSLFLHSFLRGLKLMKLLLTVPLLTLQDPHLIFR